MDKTKIIMSEHVTKLLLPHTAILERALETIYPSIDSFVIEKLLSGFSGAIIVMGKPSLKAGQGSPKNIIIKIQLENGNKNEAEAYNAFVRLYLPNGTFPHMVYVSGESPSQCLIYELSFGESESIMELRELIQIVPDVAKTTIHRLYTELMKSWHTNPSMKYGNIWDIYLGDKLRAVDKIEEAFYKSVGVRIPDRFYSSILGSVYDNPFNHLKDFKSLGQRNRSFFEVIIHGDLNARNVLIERRSGAINLIDFANTSRGHFCYDFAKLETVTITELFSQLPFGMKIPVVNMFVENLSLEDSYFFQLAKQYQLNNDCRESFLIVKAIRDSFLSIFPMLPKEELFENYKISLIYFLLKSLKYIDITRSDKLLAFYFLSSLVNSIEKNQQILKEKAQKPIFAIEEIERLSPSFVKQLNRDDLNLLLDSTIYMRQAGAISDLDFYLYLGKIKYSNGEWDSSFQEYQKLMEMAKSGSHMWYLSEALLGLGLIEHVKGKIYVGRDYFMRAKRIKEEHCHYDLEGLAEVYMRLGWGEEDIGTLQDALEFYETALKYAKDSLENRVVVNALHDLGVAYWKQGKLDRAKNLFQEGYIIAKKIELHKMMAYHLLGLARVAWSEKESNTEGFFNKSIQLFREINYKRGLAIALTEYGNFLSSKKEFDKSMKVLSEARNLKQSLGEKRELHITEIVIATNLLKLNDAEGAKKLLCEAINGLDSLGVQDLYADRARKLLSTIIPRRGNA